jgi:hypothetical protein
VKNSIIRSIAMLAVASSLAFTFAPRSAGAQESRGADPMSRLDPSTRYAVEMLMDSARLAGLPYGPLESKALEGISKRANGRDILVAVRRVFRSLREARTALGPAATPDELTAAAGVLRVGVAASELTRLAATREGKGLTVPLVVLADLVTRGVPRDTASITILQLWQHGAADDDFLGLWRSVERDIVSGTDPGVALLNRARQIPAKGPSTAVPPAAGVRPEEPKS